MQSNFVETEVKDANLDPKTENKVNLENNKSNDREKYLKKIEINLNVIDFLLQKYPNCFAKDGPLKPLKLGIFDDLLLDSELTEKFSKTNIRSAIRYYTMSWKYLECVVIDAPRVDLSGNPIGHVDEAQATHAKIKLDEAKAKVKARKENAAKKNTNKKAFKENFKPNKVQKDEKRNTDKRKSFENKAKYNDKVKSENVVANPKHVNETSATIKAPSSKKVTDPINASSLKVGTKVKIAIGQTSADANIIELSAENVIVSLATGMKLTVKYENLIELL